ncbi:hypothetical protein HHI36_012173 [Cryptolaemus montrouzieri]|uniref:Major facilitator superfamily (MFS) profile domain-containing protein n=1 Tax=Cryptolaemus montrouzieri TaxID=559131 RepID=A0ABD2NDH3_9CUCU
MTLSDDILDDIILQIGGIGKYQFVVIICISLVMLLHSAAHISYVFTSMDSEYRCLVPECEATIAADPDWLRNVIPSDVSMYDGTSKCLMYERLNVLWDIGYNCSIDDFDKNSTKHCPLFYFYDDEYYIGREFNLLCEDNLWKLSLVGTTNTFGMFLGMIVTGFISDRYGRKSLLLFGMAGCGVVGLIKTLSPSFIWFLIFELIEAILSAGTCCCVFIMAVELVIPSKRALMGTILNSVYSLGEVLVALVAWSCRSWKLLIYYIYGPCVMLILLYYILPESIRWMLSKGRIEESKEALRNIATVNKKNLSEETLNKLDHIKPCKENTHKFSMILNSPRLRWRFFNCCFAWLTCAFLFYGITLNSVRLYGNKYSDFILISLTELPAYWSCNFLVEKLGRRRSIYGSYFLTCIACLCFIPITKSSGWLHLFIYCMGKMGATAAFYVIYVITSELFPTPLRHTVMGLSSTVGRLGSLTSPQIPLLSRIWEPLPLLMFAAMSFAAGIASLFFPETKGITLPDTIEEAEEIQNKTSK